MSIDIYVLFYNVTSIMDYNIFININILNNQKIQSLSFNKNNYQSSISILCSRMFLQVLKMVVRSIASTSSPQRETHVRASRVFKFNPLRTWLLISFCLETPLSQITIFDRMSIISCQSCISACQFVCHSRMLPHMRQASNIDLLLHSCRSVSINRSSPYTCHILLRWIETSTLSFQATI